MYLSINFKKKNLTNCSFLKIVKAKIDQKKIEFHDFIEFDKCLKNILGGRIAHLNTIKYKGILFSTGASDTEKNLSQDDKSPFGKIIFFPEKKKNTKYFPKDTEILKVFLLKMV